jgi:hypothetical protein
MGLVSGEFFSPSSSLQKRGEKFQEIFSLVAPASETRV